MIHAGKTNELKLRPLNLSREARMIEEEDPAALMNAIVKQRDRKAFARLVEQFEGPAFRLALHLANRRELAEDAVQEAMLAVWFGAETFRPGSDLRKWILGIVAHRALKIARKRQKSARDREWERERRAARGPARAPGEQAERQEILDKLRGMLSGLPDIERQLVALYYGAGLTQQQIGNELKMPRRTVAFKLQETLKSLRKSLAGAGLAAAPVLSDQLLAEGLTGGPAVTTNILESILAASQQPYAHQLHQYASRSSRTGCSTRASAGGGSKTVLVALLLLLGLGAVWAVPPGRSPAPVSPPMVDAPVVAAPPEPAELRTWSYGFDGEINEGFDLLKGRARLSGIRTTPRKVLVLDEVDGFSSAILLPDMRPKLPVRVRGKIWIYQSGRMHIGMGWTDGVRTVDAKHWPTKERAVRPGELVNFTGYFIGPYIVRMSEGRVGGLSMELEALSRRRLYLVGRNIAVEEVVVEELSEEDIPKEFRDIEVFAKSFGTPDHEVPGAQWRADAPRNLAEYLKEKPQKQGP